VAFLVADPAYYIKLRCGATATTTTTCTPSRRRPTTSTALVGWRDNTANITMIVPTISMVTTWLTRVIVSIVIVAGAAITRSKIYGGLKVNIGQPITHLLELIIRMDMRTVCTQGERHGHHTEHSHQHIIGGAQTGKDVGDNILVSKRAAYTVKPCILVRYSEMEI
jgi:hypothetical protein